MTQQRSPNSYDNLELKVGGKYLDRNGEEVTIVLDRDTHGQFRFVDSNGNSYTNFGWFDFEYDSHNQMKELTLEYGLIEEISDSKQEGSSLNPFVFGDFVNSVIAAGSTVGQPGKVTGIVGDTVFVDWGTFTSQYNYRDLVVYSDARVGDNFLNHIMDDLDKQEVKQEDQTVTEETINEFLEYVARKMQLNIRYTVQLWESFNEEKSVKESDEFKQYWNLHEKYKKYLET